MPLAKVQLGKNGVTDNFISTLRSHFLKHANVKVHVLKGAGHDKTKVKEFKEELLEKLGVKYSARVIGFVIAIKRLGRDKTETN
jgi:RNA-binding protein YhbY